MQENIKNKNDITKNTIETLINFNISQLLETNKFIENTYYLSINFFDNLKKLLNKSTFTQIIPNTINTFYNNIFFNNYKIKISKFLDDVSNIPFDFNNITNINITDLYIFYNVCMNTIYKNKNFITFSEMGTNINETFNPYYKKIDRITILKDNKKLCEKKYKRKITRIYEKISNKIKDLYWKASNYLCKKFNTICIGKLNTISIVRNNKSNISEKLKDYYIHCHIINL